MNGSRRITTILLAFLIIALAGGLRLLLFSGFVLGDDPAYADYVYRIISNGYPRIGTHEVFACRPLLLYAIALPIALLGWQEWVFVLPVLTCSLVNIGLVFIAGYWLAGLSAAILASIVYSTFPLDVVHATTMSNDIVLSTLVWSGACLFFAAQSGGGKKRFLLASCGGIVTGAAVAVKISAAAAPAVLVPVFLLYLFFKNSSRRGYATVCWWLCGWAGAQALLMLFLYAHSGDPLAHYHAEMRFNRDFNPSGYVPGSDALIQFLLYYPLLITGMLQEGHQGYRMMPYGYFFLCFLLCLILLPLRRFHAIWVPALCGLWYLLVMEFMPLKISPSYVPIHRLPRFLHIVAMPAAVTIGIAFSILCVMHSKIIRAAATCALVFLLASSCYWAWQKAAFYQDCGRDQRWAWETAALVPAARIMTDSEMKNYFMFRSGFRPAVPVMAPPAAPVDVPRGSLIIAGGARRPDIDPLFASAWRGDQTFAALRLVAETRFPLQPWRRSQVQVYWKD